MAVAAAIFATVSCVEKEPHQPGEPEVDGCYGVYFPAQESNLNLDPAEPLTASIAVVRTVSNGAITVPYTLIDEAGVFSASALTFEDGQTESTIELTFPNAEVGVSYSCSFIIEDPQYAAKYNTNPVALDFSVVREKWNNLGKGTWMETGAGLFNPFGVPVTILQNDNNKNLYRVEMRWTTEDGTEDYMYASECGDIFEFVVLQPGDVIAAGTAAETKITNSGLVFYEDYSLGKVNSNYDEPVYYVHPVFFSNTDISYNKVIQYQPNGLPAGVAIAPFAYLYQEGGGWNFSTEAAVNIIFPGAVLTDYSLEIETGLSVDGELPVEFTYGTDVASAKYAVYEGTLNSAQKDKFAVAIGDGSETAAKDVPEGGVFSVAMEKTGVYTIIGVTFDAEGNPQQSDVAEFSYVAKGDNKPVSVSAGMVATGKYGENYSSDNTLEFYVYGKDIVDAKVEVFTTEDFESDPEACEEVLMESESVSAEELAEINDGALVGVFTDRAPGTEYTLLVYASNGYESTVISATTKTTGKLEVTVEDMLGKYAVNGTSYFSGPLAEPEVWIIEKSDDAEKGNVMLTAFASFPCSKPIYATVDTDLNVLSIPSGQFFFYAEAQGYNMYFMNGESNNPVSFNIIGKGKFSGPSELFGIYILDDTGAELGYYDAYSSISAAKYADIEIPAEPAALSIQGAEISGKATPNRPIMMIGAEREVKAASFTVGTADAASFQKTQKEFDSTITLR